MMQIGALNHYQSVYGIDLLLADAIHPLVNCGHNTPIADLMMFNIRHMREKVSVGRAAF